MPRTTLDFKISFELLLVPEIEFVKHWGLGGLKTVPNDGTDGCAAHACLFRKPCYEPQIWKPADQKSIFEELRRHSAAYGKSDNFSF